jgi:hypothetical protein
LGTLEEALGSAHMFPMQQPKEQYQR